MDVSTQQTYKELSKHTKNWEQDIRYLETIMLQKHMLLVNLEELKEQTKELKSQNDELLGMNNYLVTKAKEIRDSIEFQGLSISELDKPTQDSFRILEAENKHWEETEVRALQTIMLQNQILLSSIQDLKKELKERDQRIETQNQTILDQSDYLVKITQQNEDEKQLTQERKLKRLTAQRKEPLDCLTLDEFFKILFDIIPEYHESAHAQSRLRIGLFIMYFTGLRVSNLLILTVKQMEELMQSELGTELLINKQALLILIRTIQTNLKTIRQPKKPLILVHVSHFRTTP